MRTLSEILLTIVAVFLALRLGWPWPLGLISLYYVAFLFKLLALARKINLPNRLRDASFLFLFLWSLCGNVIFRELSNLGDPNVNMPVSWSPLAFLFGTDTARAYWALWLGMIPSAALILVVLVFYGYFAARAMFSMYEQYQGQEWRAVFSAISLFLGIDNGVWIVKNNAVQVAQSPKTRFSALGGPGVLVVHTGHLAILEQGGMVSRFVGRGVTLLEPFERISMVVPLYTRVEKLTIEKAVSKDRVIIEQVELLVFHRIDAGTGPIARDGQFTYNRQAILQKIWSPNGNDWRDSIRSIAESVARDMIGRYDLDQMVPISADTRETFKKNLATAISKVSRPALGVQVSAVDIGKIKIAAEAEERLLGKWIADWDQKIDTTRADTEGTVLTKRAMARQRAIEAIVESLRALGWQRATPHDVIALRFIEYLEEKIENGSAAPQGDIETLVKLKSVESLQEI